MMAAIIFFFKDQDMYFTEKKYCSPYMVKKYQKLNFQWKGASCTFLWWFVNAQGCKSEKPEKVWVCMFFPSKKTEEKGENELNQQAL